MKKRILSIVLTLCMVLMLVPISASAMVLYVNLNITGAAQLTLDVESGDSIDNVKSKIENETGHSKTIQILMYNGQVLQNERTLADYNIQKESTIELSLAPSVFAPSVTAYATKEQLMDGTFAPNAGGTANNIGRLVFGKNSNGDAQEWYILGNDDGVTGDNTIIFAASPIATGQKFNSSTSNKNFQSSFGVYGTEPSAVYSNHYGASDLRAALKVMETSNFTEAEQNLMNDTTVTTNDTKNSTTYTTTDTLYALQRDYNNDQYLRAGSNDSTVLAMNSYWSSGDMFWLRSPDRNTSNSMRAYSVYLADPNKGNFVFTSVAESFPVVRPASNLNLSSVLFASAATGGAGSDINSNMPMKLRLDGSSKAIGSAICESNSKIVAKKDPEATGNVYLVVQGNDGKTDWFYSVAVDNTVELTAEQIAKEMGVNNISLSNCKIWMETNDNGLTYAVAENGCSTEAELQNAIDTGASQITLADEITLTSTINLSDGKDITLDLNGYVIEMTGSGSAIRVNSNCGLTLQDSRPDAVHTGENASLPDGGVITGGRNSKGAGVFVEVGASFTMNGGTITDCSADSQGGGVYNAGSLTMNGGSITGCSASSVGGLSSNGGGVFNKGSLTMNGGSITGCSADHGDGVYNESGSTTAMRANGGEIEGLYNNDFNMTICKDDGKDGTIFSGDVTNHLSTIDAGIYRGAVTNAKGSSDTVGGTISGGTFEVTVTNNNGATISGGTFMKEVQNAGTISGGIFYGGLQNEDSGTVTGTYHTVSFDLGDGSGDSIPTQWFVNVSDASALEPGEPKKEGAEFVGWYNGDTKYDFNEVVRADIALTAKWLSDVEVSTEDELKDALNADTTSIKLSDSFKLSSNLNLSDKIITLDLNGHTLTGNIILADTSAAPNSILTLIDSNPDGDGVIKGNIELTRGSYGNVSHLYANGGTITGKVSLNSYIAKMYCTNNTPTAIKGYVGNTGEIHGGMLYGYFNTKCIKENTVTFMNSGKQYALEVMADDNNVAAPIEPTKDGYTFVGWYNGETKYDFGSTLSENITLTAKWKDVTGPVISGIENESTYCSAQTVSVTDNDSILRVIVNGDAVSLDENNQFTLSPAEGKQSIIALDKAGNVSSKMIVTVNDGHKYQTVPTKKATTSANGTAVTSCTVCGDVESTATIYYPKTVKLQATSYIYGGKTITPSVTVEDSNGKTISESNYTVSYANGRKSVGIYKVKVTFKGNYSGYKNLEFNINPKGTSISSVSGAKKAFTVKWKKQSAKMATSTITGYQIRYSTSSKMTSAKINTVKGYKSTNKKITKLSANKKYYVQVRTYKTVSGKTYYSSWSKVKSVKTK